MADTGTGCPLPLPQLPMRLLHQTKGAALPMFVVAKLHPRDNTGGNPCRAAENPRWDDRSIARQESSCKLRVESDE